MEELIIKNGTILTMDRERPVIEKGVVIISDGIIKNIDKMSRVPIKKRPNIIDAKGCAVLPGLVNTHVHSIQNLMKGFRDDYNLMEWVDNVTTPRMKIVADYYKKKKFDLGYAGALLASIEALKSGTTCLSNMDWSSNLKLPLAYQQTGIRAVHAISMADQHLHPSRLLKYSDMMKLVEKIITRWHGKSEERITCRYGPSDPYTCSQDLLEKVREMANDSGIAIHTHISETKWEREHIVHKTGKPPVEYLDGIGFLGPDVIAAHCIWVSNREIKMLGSSKTCVSYNPESNAKLGSGIAPISDMIKNKVVVGLASDGCASNDNLDMFEAMRIGAMLGKVGKLDPTALSAYVMLEMATLGGAKALGMERQIGSLEEGKKADIILVDLTGVHIRPINNIVYNLVYCANGRDVKTVVIDGQIVMENRELKLIDEEKTIEKAEKIGVKAFGEIKSGI